MLEIKEGEVLNNAIGIICNQANCSGVMAGGILGELKNRYPKVFAAYSKECACRRPSELMGKVQILPADGKNRFYIANLFTQIHFGHDAETDYTAFKKAFTSLEKYAAKKHLWVSIPYKIGCRAVIGDWDKCYKILCEIFENSPVHATIWKRPDNIEE